MHKLKKMNFYKNLIIWAEFWARLPLQLLPHFLCHSRLNHPTNTVAFVGIPGAGIRLELLLVI